MSEIKGQLLGIILVLLIFAAVSVTLTTVFSGLASGIQNEVTEITNSAGILV